MIDLRPVPLTRESFAPFGDVITADDQAKSFMINNGTTTRYHDLAKVDVGAEGGHTLINIFRAEPYTYPLELTVMERHPLASQAFMPLGVHSFLVVVAKPGPEPAPEDLRAFISDGTMGVNYARGTWHHPVLAMDKITDFMVIDRGGPGDNLDEIYYEPGLVRLFAE